MSKDLFKLGEHTFMYYGTDNALGYYVDICDTRYANHPLDYQGEGYVLEWSALWGIHEGTNMIGATREELIECLKGSFERIKEVLLPKIETFIASLPDPDTMSDIHVVESLNSEPPEEEWNKDRDPIDGYGESEDSF